MDSKAAFTKMSEIFASVGPYVKDAPSITLRREKCGRKWESNKLSTYASVNVVEGNGFSPRTVEPTPELVAFLRKSMILANYDTVFFKVYIYPDNTGRVWASYGQIIGTRFLCELTADETKLFTDPKEE